MACCGKTIAKAAVIVAGNLLANIDALFILPKERHELMQVRLVTCRKCQNATWLYIHEYAEYFKANNINVIKELAELVKHPKLPKMDQRPKTKLFCSICKCWLPAKAAIKKEICPQGLWPKDNND